MSSYQVTQPSVRLCITVCSCIIVYFPAPPDFPASLQLILTLNWKNLQCFQPPKYNFRSPVSLWKLCSMWSSPPTGYLSFSIVSKFNQKHWCEVKGILLKCRSAQKKAEWIKTVIHEQNHEQNAVENTHVHTSIPLNRCELCNLWHRKIFHKFAGENLAWSHVPLLCWREHRRWNKTQ